MSYQSDRESSDRQLFDRISEMYCTKDLLPASREARKTRLQETLMAVKIGCGNVMLEVGCGAGFAAEYLDGMYARYVGVDYSSDLVGFAVAHNANHNADFVVANIKEYDSQERYDIIFMIGVLHHVEDIPGTLKHIISLVKPGGVLVVNEPQPNNPLISLARKLRKRFDDNYSSDQVELSAQQILEYFQDAGLDIKTIRPQGFFATPFAEVVMPVQRLAYPLAWVLCVVDRWLGKVIPSRFGLMLSWNVVVGGEKPQADLREVNPGDQVGSCLLSEPR